MPHRRFQPLLALSLVALLLSLSARSVAACQMPPPSSWYIITVTADDSHLQKGISVEGEQIPLALTSQRDEVVYVLGPGTVVPADAQGLGLPPGLTTVQKLENGHSYDLREGVWAEAYSYQAGHSFIYGNVAIPPLTVQDDRGFTRPEDVIPPAPQESQLLLATSGGLFRVPLRLTHKLDPAFVPPSTAPCPSMGAGYAIIFLALASIPVGLIAIAFVGWTIYIASAVWQDAGWQGVLRLWRVRFTLLACAIVLVFAARWKLEQFGPPPGPDPCPPACDGRVFTKKAPPQTHNLQGASLRGATIGAELPGLNLTGADLRGADLRRADLSGYVDDHRGIVGTQLKGMIVDETTQAEGRWKTVLQIYAGGGPHALAGADLSYVDLRGVDLRQADLTGANLKAAMLNEADLRQANLSDAQLVHAELSGARLEGAILGGDITRAWEVVDLSGAVLDGATFTNFHGRGLNFTGALLRKVDLRGAVLSYANFTMTDLSGADLRDAQIISPTLKGTNMRGAQVDQAFLSAITDGQRHTYWLQNGRIFTTELAGVDLQHADLAGVALPNANLQQALLQDANLSAMDLTGALLGGAQLERANLSAANLTGAKLTGAKLTGANLRGTNLRGADLTGVDLSWADLREADLEGARLDGANLLGADLRGARLRQITADPAAPRLNLALVQLTEAELQDAQLQNAFLAFADLSAADFTGAALTGADLTGATLTGATVTQEQLDSAIMR